MEIETFLEKPILMRYCTVPYEQCPTIFNLKKHVNNENFNFNCIKTKNIKHVKEYIKKYPNNMKCLALSNNFESELCLKNSYDSIYNYFVDMWNKNVKQNDFLIKLPKRCFKNIVINDKNDFSELFKITDGEI